MALHFLRRWLGESRALEGMRVDLAEANARADRHQADYMRLRHLLRFNEARHARVEALNDELTAANRAHLNDMALLLEPAKAVRCDKTRLRDADEAGEFARSVEADRRLAPGTLEGYACKECPRHPVSLQRFWHITNSDEQMRGPNPTKGGRRSPGLITHVTPAVMADLKKRAQGGAA